ncbi:hypothetical protein ABT330_35525 [Streptomyces sp. NPDC000658]|uniref:hypothetical protein n=1 Tax=Streptomyces sp. NPDC000658 TaxID=3154266 RepID=UPI00331E2581
MSMIAAPSAAASSSPTGALILLAVLGVAAVCFGARWAFNLRGAVDTTLARRRAALELRGARTGDLSLAETDGVSAGFFRLVGGVLTAAGLVLLVLSLALAAG